MRVLIATCCVTMGTAMPAAASSVMLHRAATQPSPSVIMFVEPAVAAPPVSNDAQGGAGSFAYPAPPPAFFDQDIERVSPSIIAMGEPGVENTMVASIAKQEKRPRNPHLPPMVIRAGLSGEAFVRGDGLSRTAEQLAAGSPTPPAVPQPGQDPAPDQPAAPAPVPAVQTRSPE